ncbi:hypothetical protein C8R46DRAFT_1071991 [Mycena filopes]|nr:hypothetical protein C8R46DRAFT_1071991 [Mycena filopes]
MTTRTQTSSSPFSRLSLYAKGGQSQAPRAREQAARTTADDDYIPYNGPYEAPPRRRQRSRDSWGDPLYDEDGNTMIQEVHQRYVPPIEPEYPWRDEDQERKGRPRARTHSAVSGRTVSSGTVDPHHANAPITQTSRVHQSRHTLTLMRQAAFSREVAPPKRSSLASIFTFGQSSKRLPLSPAKIALPTMSNAKYPEQPASGPPSIYSSSLYSSSQEGDAYHSYYNYTPAADQFGHLSSPHTATPPPHPYAYNLPQRDFPDPPPTAPLLTSPKLKFTPRFALPQQQQEPASAIAPRVRSLKNSASTPNLRDASQSPNRLRKPLSPGLPKGKDRWLSAETWCDAVMFPRPRLKAEDAQLVLRGASWPDRQSAQLAEPLTAPRGWCRVSLRTRGVCQGPSKLKHKASFGAIPRDASPVMPPPPIISFAWDDLALPSPVPSLARVLEEGQILEHQRKKWQMQATGSFQNTRARSLSRSRAKSLTQKGAKAPAGQSSMDYLAARSLLGNQNAVPVLPARLHKRTNSQGGNTNATSTFNTRTSHSHSNSLVKTASRSSLSQGHSHSRHDSWSRTAFKKAAAICYVDGALSPADEHPGGLENALRNGGTKVIRLADPALIPVDMSGPLGALSPRTGVSPAPSAGSDALVGIAISTPPQNDNASSDRDSIHLQSHPYAQGGLLSYHNAVPAATTNSAAKGADYAGPHPTAAIANPDPTDFSARHRLPPQASLTYHPYATTSRRDSYQVVPHANSDVPPQSKMWAQLSPGVVREILPGELVYSPFMSERTFLPERSPTPEEERDSDLYAHLMRNRKSTVTILDTVGLGETLAYAVEVENNRDSGHGTSEEQPTNTAPEWVDDGQAEADAVAGHHPYRIHRKPVQYDISRPPYTPKKSGVSSNTKSGISNHTVASSTVNPSYEVKEHRPTPPLLPQPSSSSPILNSAASSPPRSPPAIGSVDDLDEFRDLFYKPNLTDEFLNNLSRPPSTRQSGVTWDLGSTTRTQRTRTGSGLTSLARQLSQEFEELRAMRRSGTSVAFSRFPTENDIQFIFTDSDMSRGVLEEEPVRAESPEEALHAFHPSNHLPEDVESSRASSPGIDGAVGNEDEEDEPFRLGSVGSVVTPAADFADHRTSYTGQMAFHDEPEPPVPKAGIPIPRAVSNLQPHSADPTRSSYMTESSVSRMSGLSDFPAPPPQHMTPAHMSLLSSYFHEAPERTVREDESVVTFSPRIGERF